MIIRPDDFEATRYWVESESNPAGPPHLVDSDYDGAWACSCPDHMVRERVCKHIRAVQRLLGVQLTSFDGKLSTPSTV